MSFPPFFLRRFPKANLPSHLYLTQALSFLTYLFVIFMYETLKSLHLIFVISWFAGLFYLPRLFVYHASTEDRLGIERFKVMEHKLFNYIMTPAMILALGAGTWLWLGFGFEGGWLHLKLLLVVLLVIYHFFCYRFMILFAEELNPHSERFYRIFNEAPTLLLAGIVFLVVFKPF